MPILQADSQRSTVCALTRILPSRYQGSLFFPYIIFSFASRWEISSSGYSIIRVDFFSYLVYLQLENIFLHRGKPLLGDWGFATSFVPGMRVQQEFIGSPSYCAPEIWLFQPYEGACLCFSVLVSCSVALFFCFMNVFRPGEQHLPCPKPALHDCNPYRS